MTKEQAIEILRRHNEWRRGADIEPTNVIELGQAIDVITKKERMTPSRFIRKWLGNPDKQYDYHNRMEMGDDLDSMAEWYANSGTKTQPKQEVYCTCIVSLDAKDSLVPVYCHNCRAYVKRNNKS